MDPILDTGSLNAPCICKGQVDSLRACDTMEAKITKYHALSRKFGMFCRRVCYPQDQTELPDGYSLTSLTENSSKVGLWWSPICTFFI